MDRNRLICHAKMWGKNIRVISFTKNQIFTINHDKKKLLSVEEVMSYADCRMHEEFDNIIRNVTYFSEIDYDRIRREQWNSDHDVLVIHEPINTQFIDTDTGKILWKRVYQKVRLVMDIINKKYRHIYGDVINVNKILPGFHNHKDTKFCLCEIKITNGEVISEYIMNQNTISMMIINKELIEEGE